MVSRHLRDVSGLGKDWPLLRIDAQGKTRPFGQLIALHLMGTQVAHPRVEWLCDGFIDGYFPGIPWFLDDHRPQGFLGRQFARRWAGELRLSHDIRYWNDDAVLAAMTRHGGDGPGDFRVGRPVVECHRHDEPWLIASERRAEVYSRLAVASNNGDGAGALLPGEFPKFTTCIRSKNGERRHVIVKYSEPVATTPAARRWADLLVCEHIASKLLNEKEAVFSPGELIVSDGRICLEVTRFDRIGSRGRRGCVSLAAWSDAYHGGHDAQRDSWPIAVSRMTARRWVTPETVNAVRKRWWFGRLIGNTDMHLGNLSFFLDDTRPLTLTPAYDMLPMVYQPGRHGVLPNRTHEPPLPMPEDRECWEIAAGWAQQFWARVSVHPCVSGEFRRVAHANCAAVRRARSCTLRK